MKPISDFNPFSLGEYFYKLAEHSQDVFWVRYIDNRAQIYISPAYEKIWGSTRDDLYEDAEVWYRAIHEEDRDRVRQDINRVRNNPQVGDSYSHEYRIIRSDNEIRWIQDSGFPLFDTNNQLLGYAGVAKDITYEKARLAELTKANYFFRIYAEKAKQSVFWACDPRYEEQIYVSPSYEKIWGKSCESLYKNPKSWNEPILKEDRDLRSIEKRLELLKLQGPNIEYEGRYRIYNPEGKIIWIKDTSFPIFDGQNNLIGFAGIAEDVTKDVLLENELRKAKQRAEVANQAKSDFLAMVSHELRTPLNAILGMAQVLNTRGLSKEVGEFVNVISNAGNNLLALVNDILDFVTLEAGKLSFKQQPFNLHLLIAQIIQSMQYQAMDKGLNLSLDYPATIPNAVIGDQNRIRQILVNLLSNSIKFTEHGFIKVIVRCNKILKKKVIIEVAVIDTGIGIAKDKLNYIFERFNQINPIYYRKHQGLGLGLTITKELVEKMGGKIQAKSEYGRGSQFKFKLPFLLQESKENHTQTNARQQFKSPKRQYGFNILLVEDNVINQKIAKVMLEDFGCRVDIIDNGAEVLQKIVELSQYHLIFMDIGLPDMSGFEIVNKLRQDLMLKNIPIVAMTAHILERDRQTAFHSGMQEIIAKPISYEEIELVLESLINKKLINYKYSGNA